MQTKRDVQERKIRVTVEATKGTGQRPCSIRSFLIKYTKHHSTCENVCPRVLFTGAPVDYKKEQQVAFGDYEEA
jgi:hypothetical protein